MKRKELKILAQKIVNAELIIRNSEDEKAVEKAKNDILSTLTQTREENNLNQYLFLDYMYLKGKLTNKRLSKKHFSLGIASEKKIRNFLKEPTHSLVCINDVQMSKEKHYAIRKVLTESFEQLLPQKSKYEK